MSTRTFFRYFASKEEVLFGPMHATLNESIHFLEHSAPLASPHAALKATVEYLARQYQQQQDSFLLRYRVALQTPSIASYYVYALLESEIRMSQALSSRLNSATSQHEVNALVALYMAAFRLALVTWLEREAQEDLVLLLRDQLGFFSSLSLHM